MRLWWLIIGAALSHVRQVTLIAPSFWTMTTCVSPGTDMLPPHYKEGPLSIRYCEKHGSPGLQFEYDLYICRFPNKTRFSNSSIALQPRPTFNIPNWLQ